MGWERRKREHTCRLPDEWEIQRKGADVGDVWTCRRCKARWELTYPGITSDNRSGPMHEPRWIKHGSPEDIWRDGPLPSKGPMPPPPAPRQTGTDWLYSVEEGKA